MVQSTPLDASTAQFPPSMQAVLARLTAADLLMTSSPTVYEITALVRDLSTVCGPEITFKAIAQHVNDVYTGAEHSATYTTAYYNGNYNSDIIKGLPSGQILSQGQEVALCMFIRAELPLPEMVKVISYGQLIAYLHGRITAANAANSPTSFTNETTTAATSEGALTTTLKNSRRYQYDISSLVNSSGVPSVLITNQIASANELLRAINDDTVAIATGTGTTLISQKNLRLWLLAKVTDPTHDIRRMASLTLTNYSYFTGAIDKTTASTLNDYAVQGTTSSAFDFGFKFTGESSGLGISVFAYTDVITYILTVSSTQTALSFNGASIYLNGASSSANGSINRDALINPQSVASLTIKDLKTNNATFTNLHDLGFSIDAIIDALNRPESVLFTISDAVTGGWTAKEIGESKFSFSDKTSIGKNFQYFTLAGADKPEINHALLKNLVDLYNESTDVSASSYIATVKTAFRTFNGTSRDPATPRDIAIAVIVWLFTNFEAYTTGTRTATKIMLANGVTTSVPFFQSFLNAPFLNNQIALSDVFNISKVPEANADGLSLKNGFTAYEAKTYFGVTAGIARDNGWAPSLISATFRPSEIFSNEHKRQAIAYKAASPYGLSVVEALIGYNITKSAAFFTQLSGTTNAVTGAEMIGSTTNTYYPLNSRYNYDGIPFETLARLLSPSAIVDDIKVAMVSSVAATTAQTSFNVANQTLFPALDVTSSNISAFLDALNLPFPIASRLVGASYGTNTNVTETDLANTTIYSKVERRSVFTSLADAASKYAQKGYPVKSFIALGFPVSAWAAYLSPSNISDRSINVSLRELLSAWETVDDYDDDFYVTSSTKRALYHTVKDRVELILAFIPNLGATPEGRAEADRLARGPASDLPHVV